MNATIKPVFAGLAAGALAICPASTARAQFAGAQFGGAPAAAVAAIQPERALIVKDITDIGRDYAQRATSIGNRSGGRQKVWGVFDATFDTAPEWLDGVSVTYTLMLISERPEHRERPMSLYTATYEYADIMRGRDLKVGVVLPPGPLARYGKPIGFAVQFSVGGRPVGEGYGKGEGVLKGRDKWWADNNIVNNPKVQKREGLIERSKSPFALVDIDSYEVAK